MRVVVDTNVFVSAALKVGSLPAIAVHLVRRDHVLPQSAATEHQVLEVLARPYLAPLIAASTHEWIAKMGGCGRACGNHWDDQSMPRCHGRQVSGTGGKRSC
jgi:predicted nucleic acid-binding protein